MGTANQWWQSLTGTREYRTVSYHKKLAEPDRGNPAMDPRLKDSAAQLQAMNMRIGACIEHSTRVIDEVVSDLSLPLAKEPPKMIRLRRVFIRPDKINDFIALVKTEVMPFVKQSNATTYAYARVRFKYQAYLAKSSAMTTRSEVNVYRCQADLSYIPPATASAADNRGRGGRSARLPFYHRRQLGLLTYLLTYFLLNYPTNRVP